MWDFFTSVLPVNVILLVLALGVLGFLIFVIIAYRRGSRVKIWGLEIEPSKIISGSLSASAITPLKTMHDIVETVGRFSDYPIRQTFIQSYSPTASADIALSTADNEDAPSITRVIALTHPMDIDFAQHSVDLAEKRQNLKNHLVLWESYNQAIRAFPNLTIFGDKATMITFPFGRHPFPPTSNDQKDHSIGLLLEDRAAVQLTLKHFHRLLDALPKTQVRTELESAKTLFWENSQTEYLHAIADAIFKEILRDKELKAGASTLATVGSAARAMRGSSGISAGQLCQDLDILIVYDQLNGHILRQTETIVDRVLQRFSFKKVKFKPDYVACPVKPTFGDTEFVVQILLDDLDSIAEWTPFIAKDWYDTAIRRDYPNRKLPETVRIRGRYGASALIDGRYGVREWIDALFGSGHVRGSRWKYSGEAKRPIQEEITRIVMEPNKAAFAKYTIQWSAIDYARSENTKVPTTLRESVFSIVEWLLEEFRLNLDQRDIIRKILLDSSTIWDKMTRGTVEDYLKGFESYLLYHHSCG